MTELSFLPLNWIPNMQLTSESMNTMMDNDRYLDERKSGVQLTDIDPLTLVQVPKSSLITKNVGICGGVTNVSPPDKFDPDDPNQSDDVFFSVKINFIEGIFDPAYLPIVCCDVYSPWSISMSRIKANIESVRSSDFNVRVIKSTTVLFNSNSTFFVCWFAFGVLSADPKAG